MPRISTTGRILRHTKRFLVDGLLLARSRREPRQVLNPGREIADKEETIKTVYSVFDYDATHLDEPVVRDAESCTAFAKNGRVTWLNVDGLKKGEVEYLASHFGIHPLLVEDILNTGQRAKMDELGNTMFCLVPMLYYNADTGVVESEQVSLVLGKGWVISFQEDEEQDVFDPVRERLRHGNTKLRSSPADYLYYALLDIIVDSYFAIIEKLSHRAEVIEEALLEGRRRITSAHITLLRREVNTVNRALLPVRDVVNAFVRSDNALLEEANEKYFKDVHDHITQAIDYGDSLRDQLATLQDLLMSQLNTRTNDVMKVFTMVATLLAPATVIGGIYGMNFEHIPLAKNPEGFWIIVAVMLSIPLLMLVWFKRKGWF